MTLAAGVDIGSTTAKVVLLEDGKPAASAITPTGADCEAAAKKSLATALESIGKKQEDIKYIVATGYGRRAIDFGDETVTEISANARGAIYLGSQKGQVRSIIDVGGQDTKAIVLDEHGRITNFVMNDKCAAGTGRFLEVIARVLDESIESFVRLSLESNNPTIINSTCTVFAESEVISLIAKRVPKQDIISGIHRSVAKRVADMARAAGVKPIVFFDGGGAINHALKVAIERELGHELFVTENPQLVVALGAAIIAHDNYSKKIAGKS